MSKVIDITDKLSFDENPVIKIKGTEIEINADAPTVLKIMGLFNNKSETEATIEAAELLFEKKGMDALNKMKLSIKDFAKVVEIAMSMANGEDSEGEAETHTTI